MIEHVINFCAYGAYLEEHCGGSSERYFTDEEKVVLGEIISSEIERIGTPEFIRLHEERFRNSIDKLLGR